MSIEELKKKSEVCGCCPYCDSAAIKWEFQRYYCANCNVKFDDPKEISKINLSAALKEVKQAQHERDVYWENKVKGMRKQKLKGFNQSARQGRDFTIAQLLNEFKEAKQ